MPTDLSQRFDRRQPDEEHSNRVIDMSNFIKEFVGQIPNGRTLASSRTLSLSVGSHPKWRTVFVSLINVDANVTTSRYSATGANYERFDRSTGSTLTGLSVQPELVSVVSAYTDRRAYVREQTTRSPAVAPNSRTEFNSTARVRRLSKGGGWYSRRLTSRGGCCSGVLQLAWCAVYARRIF